MHIVGLLLAGLAFAAQLFVLLFQIPALVAYEGSEFLQGVAELLLSLLLRIPRFGDPLDQHIAFFDADLFKGLVVGAALCTRSQDKRASAGKRKTECRIVPPDTSAKVSR